MNARGVFRVLSVALLFLWFVSGRSAMAQDANRFALIIANLSYSGQVGRRGALPLRIHGREIEIPRCPRYLLNRILIPFSEVFYLFGHIEYELANADELVRGEEISVSL